MHPTLALITKCSAPHHLKNVEIAELQESDFECNGEYQFRNNTLVAFHCRRFGYSIICDGSLQQKESHKLNKT